MRNGEFVCLQLLSRSHSSDVGVDAVVQVHETGHVHHVASLQGAHSRVNLGLGAGQVALHAEAVANPHRRT